ncbi:MAG: SBBP repeat-containing protein [Fimbriimonadales bacterium]
MRTRLFAVGLILLTAAIGRSDQLLVAEFNARQITGLQLDGLGAHIFAGGLVSRPEGLTLDGLNNVYVSEWGSAAENDFSRITKISADGSTRSTLANQTSLLCQFVLRDTDILVPDFGSFIQRFDYSGTYLGNFAQPLGVSGPMGLAADSVGNIFVAGHSNGTVFKYDPTGQNHSTFLASGPVDGEMQFFGGNLYMARGNGVSEFDANAGLIHSFSVGSPVLGAAVDSSGFVYASVPSLGTIVKFAPDGTNLGTIATGLSDPQFLAIQSVPEPASVIAFAGLAIISVRRRRRQ